MTLEGHLHDTSTLGMFFSFKLASNLLSQPGLCRPLETWLAHMSTFQAWRPHLLLITCIALVRGCCTALGIAWAWCEYLVSLGKESTNRCGTGWPGAKGEKLRKKHVCDPWALGQSAGHLDSLPTSSMKHATTSLCHTFLLLKLIAGNFCRCEGCPPSQPGRHSLMFQL